MGPTVTARCAGSVITAVPLRRQRAVNTSKPVASVPARQVSESTIMSVFALAVSKPLLECVLVCPDSDQGWYEEHAADELQSY